MRINTNVAALGAQTNLTKTNSALSNSLSKLSSGLRINTAADDASGMSIADSLRSQKNALGQAIANANDGVSIAQIADGAMDEQIKILDTIKTKATQAAQDGQSTASRKALQSDISKLVEALDNIAGSTSYNGKNLLSGSFTNAEFQIGAYNNQTVSMTIGATSSDKIGQTRFETSAMGTALGTATVTYTPESGTADNLVMESVEIGTTAGTGIGALAAVINKNSETTGVTASWSLTQTGDQAIASGTITNLSINGTIVAASLDVKANDSNGVLVDAINQFTATTGIAASVDAEGKLNLSSTDGRAMTINVATDAKGVMSGIVDTPATAQTYTGRLTLTKAGAADIQMAIAGAGGTGLVTTAHEASVSLRDMMSEIDADTAEAMGAFANDNAVGAGQDLTAGVTTYAGAQAMIKIAQTAQEKLDTIRADIGSVQNQLTSTINNISVTQVNVSSAESQIRDVDFAEESASFSKYNIMAQAGSYALSQANSTQQNVLKLLQ